MNTVDSETTWGATDTGSSRLPAWTWASVYGLLAATLGGYVLGYYFFTEGGIYAPLSDAAALLMGLSLLLVVRAVRLVGRDADADTSDVTAIGLVAGGLIAAGSLGLIVNDLFVSSAIGGAFLGLQFLGFVLQGAWLFALGVVGRRTGVVSRRVAWAGIVAGVGYFATIVALSLALGFTHPAVLAGGLLAFGGFVLWSVWLGSDLRSRTRDASLDALGAEQSQI